MIGPQNILLNKRRRKMTTNRLTTIDLSKITPYAVGFDRIFDDMFKYASGNLASSGYPPYNIRKNGDNFQIEIALAGVDKEDLEITAESGQLTISHDPKTDDSIADGFEWIHKGIAQRKFSRSWTLSDDVVVQGAKSENGMLYIQLERIVPEEKKHRVVKIK